MQQRIWAYLIHLGYNMWADSGMPQYRENITASDTLRCDKDIWDAVTVKLAESGANMVVIDLGEAVQYESHPELACKNAWTKTQVKTELKRLRSMGLEVIPKLNFSACHDEWLGIYSRMLSTPTYYQVCSDLIAEVCELFDTPRFFHLGMDEETWEHQRNYSYATIRQGDLWWHDFYLLVEQVEKCGVHPWIWSDYIWQHEELFLKKMPKSVVQSNWYYGNFSNKNEIYIRAYETLDKHGYNQIPTGSNWSIPENMVLTVENTIDVISSDKLLGYMQTPWKPTLQNQFAHHIEAVEELSKASKIIK